MSAMGRLVDIWNGRGELGESYHDQWKTAEPPEYADLRGPGRCERGCCFSNEEHEALMVRIAARKAVRR